MTAAAIFVKTPGLSPLKTRLARDLGQTAAEQWYLHAAAAVAEAAAAAGLEAVYWAVAEPEAVDHETWRGLPCLPQGAGSLGARMARVHRAMQERHGAGLLLGADAPQLDPDWLRTASQWLNSAQPRLCLGPARDGGFWTFGANISISENRWCAVPYSQADTRARFEQAMAGLGKWHFLPDLTDVDTASDLVQLGTELAALPAPLPEQARLMTEMPRSIQTALTALSKQVLM